MISPTQISVDESRPLGTGGFGTVYRGVWEGAEVAVKRLVDETSDQVRRFTFTITHRLLRLRTARPWSIDLSETGQTVARAPSPACPTTLRCLRHRL